MEKNKYTKIKSGAVHITHVHWDHWHGVTFTITHEEPNKRSVNYLKKIGFKNIKLLKHG